MIRDGITCSSVQFSSSIIPPHSLRSLIMLLGEVKNITHTSMRTRMHAHAHTHTWGINTDDKIELLLNNNVSHCLPSWLHNTLLKLCLYQFLEVTILQYIQFKNDNRISALYIQSSHVRQLCTEYQKIIGNKDEWKKTQGKTTHTMDRPH